MENLASIVGAISGTLSFLGIIYVIGYWKGTVDTKLGNLNESVNKYPPAETFLMAKTLWDIYVMDALRQRPDLANHNSAYQLKKEARDLIPETLKLALDKVSCNPLKREEIATGWVVVKALGLSAIYRMAEEQKISVQEAIAVLSIYLDEHLDSAPSIV